MPTRQPCPNCQVVLLLPESGKGRCPKCKTIVQAIQPAAAVPEIQPDYLEPVIPEIGAEHEAGVPAEVRVSAEPPVMGVPLPPAPPEPRRRWRRRDPSEPSIDVATPLPRPSRTVPVTLLSIGLAVSLLLVIGSTIYLINAAKQPRPVVPAWPAKKF